jgi:hypothetical protein
MEVVMDKKNLRSDFLTNHLPFIIVSLVILAILLFVSLSAYSQTAWTKHKDNPVLEPGPAGSWDDHSILGTCVIKRDSVYHMWYGGSDGSNYRIGHATSTDGITWVKDSLNPVLDIGAPGSFDQVNVYIPNVLYIKNLGINGGGTFHMYYDGYNGTLEQIGHATSEDGSTWVKDTLNPVMQTGAPGSWEEFEIFPMGGSVIHHDNLYMMWYAGLDYEFKYRIGYATSTDGSNWNKHDGNPVISVGQVGDWFSKGVIPGSVMHDGYYRIWFSGCESDYRWRVGYATSADGIAWTMHPDPVLNYGQSGSWDYAQAWGASIYLDLEMELYQMFYTGGPFNDGKIGYATADYPVGVYGPVHNTHEPGVLLTCFPNPIKDQATIRYSTTEPGSITVKVYTIHGILIDVIVSAYKTNGIHEIMLHADEYSKGVYILNLETSPGSSQYKVIKR